MVRKPGQSTPIRVGIADKSPLMRAALKQLFSGDGRFQIVSASENSEDFLKAVEPASMGGGGWLDHSARTRALHPRLFYAEGNI